MPGMWELPQSDLPADDVFLKLRHSITTTDYLVLVSRGEAPKAQRTRLDQLHSLPLTGLARKILKRAELI
jgi:A/G-specific adenine glycosylase